MNAAIVVAILGSAVAAGEMPRPVDDRSAHAAEARRALSGAWTLNSSLSDVVNGDDVAQDSLVLTLGDEVVTFYQRDGSRQVYRLSGRRERRDLGSGPVWTTAAWDGATLRLRIDGAHGLSIVQTFAVDARTGRLVVASSSDPQRLPMKVVRLVYDPLIERAP